MEVELEEKINSKTSSASVNSPIIFHFLMRVNVSQFASGSGGNTTDQLHQVLVHQ